jgi:Fe-Mn family superoxide dismutase
MAIIHKLAPLPYAFDALEPHIDTKTMEVHYGGHHKAYVDNLNKTLADPTAAPFAEMEIEELLYNLHRAPASIQAPLRNNAGGHFNHTLYWNLMTPKPAAKKATGLSGAAIDTTFVSFEKFQEEFTKTALGRFGSGWAWLIVNKDGNLQITNTAYQDNPLMEGLSTVTGLPILTLDVWEHAYYLKHQNRRADYVKAWWNVVNWEQVENYYRMAMNALNKEGACCGGKGGCGKEGCGCEG